MATLLEERIKIVTILYLGIHEIEYTMIAGRMLVHLNIWWLDL